MGFDDKMSAITEALSHDIIASSEIEGVELNTEQVRSSVARKLGVPIANPVEVSRYVDGVVEMALDATVNYNPPLTHERLFGWHNCLFPTGWSGTVKIDVAQYRSGNRRHGTVASREFKHALFQYLTSNQRGQEAVL